MRTNSCWVAEVMPNFFACCAKVLWLGFQGEMFPLIIFINLSKKIDKIDKNT